jgi:hypothetical protein
VRPEVERSSGRRLTNLVCGLRLPRISLAGQSRWMRLASSVWCSPVRRIDGDAVQPHQQIAFAQAAAIGRAAGLDLQHTHAVGLR